MSEDPALAGTAPSSGQRGPDLVTIHLANAHGCSGGKGPGVFSVPRDEANRLISERRAYAVASPGEPGTAAMRAVSRGVTN